MTGASAKRTRASIPAMPKPLRPILLALILAASALVIAGCGGSSGPDPSIDKADATTLLAKLQEIQDNVDVPSPCVAAEKTDDLIADIQNLPSGVNNDVRDALNSGANNLKLQLSDDCQNRTTTETTTTTPTTTSDTTTEPTTSTTKTTPTQTQQTTPTQTQQTTPTQTNSGGGASGGIGPGGL
jgi:hypothetical protein